jgi:hypothetical protein
MVWLVLGIRDGRGVADRSGATLELFRRGRHASAVSVKWRVLGAALLVSRCQAEASPLDCDRPEATSCAEPLPTTDERSRPWPTRSELLSSYGAERGCGGVTVSSCADGKTMVERSGGFSGDQVFFLGERLVGTASTTDFFFCGECSGTVLGDVSCEDETVVEADWCASQSTTDAGTGSPVGA